VLQLLDRPDLDHRDALDVYESRQRDRGVVRVETRGRADETSVER